jgi:cytochrome c oxidase assembly protein subunit 15
LVAGWLFVVCALLLVMIVLGGATRLTGSGLSIMEWAPLAGALPPLHEAEWQRLYALYRQIPQYQLLHAGFGIDGFKQIFWLEWTHRLWGRLIGVVFLVPLIWFWIGGRIEPRLRPRLAVIFVLGGLQGAVGWFMVASGFAPDTTAVSPYRLVVHLVLALALYAAVLWTGLSVLRPAAAPIAGAAALRRLVAAVACLVVLTIVAGGFVAGLHAGLDYNTFPLMDGRWVPRDYARLDPLLRNLTENIAAVQFDHRLLATLTLGAATVAALDARRARLPAAGRLAMLVLGGAVAAQYALGVAALLRVVPVPLAVAHQAMAVLVLTASLVALHALRGARAGQPVAAERRDFAGIGA